MYEYTHRLGELFINCEFDYSEGDDGGINMDGQIDDEPIREAMELIAAEINSESIIDILSADFIETLEAAALQDLKQTVIDSI